MTKRSESGTAEITTDLRSVSSTDELKLAGISYSDQLLDFIQSEDPPGDDSLGDFMSLVMQDVCEKQGLKFAILYASPRPFIGKVETPNLLQPVAQHGLRDDEWNSLLHFNWRKAGLPSLLRRPARPTYFRYGILFDSPETKRTLERSAIGLPDRLLESEILVIPAYLSFLYRATIMFGSTRGQLKHLGRQAFLWYTARRVIITTLLRRADHD